MNRSYASHLHPPRPVHTFPLVVARPSEVIFMSASFTIANVTPVHDVVARVHPRAAEPKIDE